MGASSFTSARAGSYSGTACSASSHCKQPAAFAGCASQSNNPYGRRSKGAVAAALTNLAARDIATFKCPQKQHSGKCQGICLANCATGLEADQLVLDIQKLRANLLLAAKRSTLAQAVADYMMGMTPNKSERLHMFEMPWRVGARVVCEYCWAAAADLLAQSSNKHESLRLKSSFCDARAAYYKRIPDGLLLSLQPHGHGGIAAEYPEVVVVGRKFAVSKALPKKLESAECWLDAYCKPAVGNVQSRTDDEFAHVQGKCGADLYKEYSGQHPTECGGAGRSTFYKAIGCCRLDLLCDLKFDKWCAQAECSECMALKIMKGRATDKMQEDYYQKELDLHNLIARHERLAYGCNISLAFAAPFGQYIWSFAQDAVSSFTTSGPACHAKPLRDLKGAAGLSGAEQLRFKTTGVIVHGYGYFLYALEPHLPANANSNIYVLHKTIMYMFDRLQDPSDTEVTRWPRMITVQLDGASDNKCKAMFAYLEWLVASGTFECVWVSFLLVGHTHADYDQKFVAITKALRKTTVKCLNDLLQVYRTCYGEKDKPRVVEPIRAVPDFTSWLVIGGGANHVTGFARRVPDVQRPHRFMIERVNGEGMPGAVCKVETDYKNLASDQELMNVVKGERQPLQWLLQMPATSGPQMQGVASPLLQELRKSKPAIYRNFAGEGPTCGMFTRADIDWYDSFYAMCETDECLSAAMSGVYKWQAPKARGVEAAQVGVEHVHQKLTEVPPLCHNGFSKTDRDALIREEKKANAAEEKRLDDAVAEYLAGKDSNRGYRALSQAAKARVALHERQAIKAALGLKGCKAAANGAGGEPLQQDDSFECYVVGGSFGGQAPSGKPYENLYLVHFDGYAGADDEFQWLPAANCNFSGLAAALDGCELGVYWAESLQDSCTRTKYLCSAAELTECDNAALLAAGVGNATLGHTVMLQYNDCSAEFLDLVALSAVGCPCSGACDICNGNKTTALRARHHRVMWLLAEHCDNSMIAAKLAQVAAEPATGAGQQQKRRRQPKRGAAKKPALLSDASSDDDTPLGELMAKNTKAAKRQKQQAP